MQKAARVAAGLLTSTLVTGLLIAPGLATTAAAAPTPEIDQLAVVVVGDGTTYGNVAGPVDIQLMDSQGNPGNTIEIPVTASGDQHGFTLGVDRDQAGALQQSADHATVVVGGYEAALGAATNSSAAPETLRVIAKIDASGQVDTSTTLAGAYHVRHIRGVASVDGTRYWSGGHGHDSIGSVRAGVLTIEHGGDTPVAVTTGGSTTNNTRVPVIHNGQLYVSSDRNGYHGVNSVGAGTPENAAAMTLIAEAPDGLKVPHDFAFIGEHLYVAYTEGTPAIVRYTLEAGEWVADGQFSGQFWGLTGRVAGDEIVLYGTRGANAQNELVKIIDRTGEDFADARSQTLATAAPNRAFRGVSFAPGFVPGSGPAEIVALPSIEWNVRVAGGVGNALSAVLGADSNPIASGRIIDPETDVIDDTTLEVIARSDDQSVVADADISVTVAPGGSFLLSATPSAVGTTTINLNVTMQDGREATAHLAYWVSAALPTPDALAHVGVADASAAYGVGDGYFLVADDDSNAIRLYGPTFGEPVAEFDFSQEMTHPTDRTFDLEGAARIGDTIYWVGSLGNSRSGNYWPHRDIVMATTVSGEGADTTLNFAGEATGFRDALVAWDDANGHGFGAGALQFARATTPGYSAEGPNSLNLEGATIAPDGETLWLGFRSPLVPVAENPGADPAGNLALIIAIENIAEVVTGADIVVGESFTLDLDGRAIRDLKETGDGRYLISAGSADDTGNFALFGWSGHRDDVPVRSTVDPALSGWGGSYESVLHVPNLADGTVVRALQDVGTVDIYGTGAEAQDLTREHMKFVSHDVVLDFNGAFTPTVVIDAEQVETGETFGVVATGFRPGEHVSFTLHSTPVLLGSAVADATGVARATLTVPADVTAGGHTLVALGEVSALRASAGVTVIRPAMTPTPTHGTDPNHSAGSGTGAGAGTGAAGGSASTKLATTGAGVDATLIALASLILLAGAGGVAVGGVRLRSRNDS